MRLVLLCTEGSENALASLSLRRIIANATYMEAVPEIPTVYGDDFMEWRPGEVWPGWSSAINWARLEEFFSEEVPNEDSESA
jgi:hypothetical protein